LFLCNNTYKFERNTSLQQQQEFFLMQGLLSNRIGSKLLVLFPPTKEKANPAAICSRTFSRALHAYDLDL